MALAARRVRRWFRQDKLYRLSSHSAARLVYDGVMPRSWLLVYLADAARDGERWLDKGNDPDMRALPMTWGICRTDTRIGAKVGDDLFFVACGADRPISERYYLAAQFRVAEKIGWPEAVARFAGRPNIIVEPLPPGSSLAERVVSYVRSHSDELRWNGRRRVLASLREGGGWLREHADDFVVTLGGRDYVHASYDGHGDWRTRRLDGPYLVADEVASRILDDPIPYVELAAACPELPPVEMLRTPGRQPRHNRRVLTPMAAWYLRSCVGNGDALHRASGSA